MNLITEVTQVLQSLLLLSNSITLIGENSAFCSGRPIAQKTIQPLPPCPPEIKWNQINPTLQLGIYYLEITSFPQNSPQRENSPIAKINYSPAPSLGKTSLGNHRVLYYCSCYFLFLIPFNVSRN